MNVSTISTQVQALMTTGKTLEEALQLALAEAQHTQVRRDNIEYIKTLHNIPEVRRMKKVAYAKISKSKGKDDAIARYKLEVEAADEKLNELLAEVNSAKKPWEKAMELGEDAAAAFNYYLSSYKDNVDKLVDKKTKGITKAEVKVALLKINPEIPEDFPEMFKSVAAERVHNGDMMLVTVLRKVAYLKSLKK